MSDTKHTPEPWISEYAELVNGTYSMRCEAVEKYTALRAAAEKARNRWIGYETALEEILKLEASLGTAFSWAELRTFKESTRKIAQAALEEVLK